MLQTYTLKQKLKQLLVILLPVLITQITMFAMSFFDTTMSGHASARDLAGVAIGSSIWLPISTGFGGIFVALTPLIAQLIGANRIEEVPFKVSQGVYLALACAFLVLISGVLLLNPLLSIMNLEYPVREIANKYLLALSFGIPPLFVYLLLRSFIDGLGQTRVSMTIALLALPINISLNYVFIYGKLGLPALGGIGTGVATAITYWCLAAVTLLIVLRTRLFSTYKLFKRIAGISFPAWKEQLKIGIPIGFSIFFETSIFAVIAILMSAFDTVTIAAHQAALNFASLLYMVPLSMSMSLTILVGFEAGGKRFRDAKQYSYLGMVISIGMAFLCALVLLLFRDQIALLYSQELAVINLTKQFLVYALFFQLSDAIAAPIQGSLRGYKDVNVTLFLALFSYWVLGLPTGYYLATYTSFGASGYWIGLVTGLAFNAFCLVIRIVIVQRKRKATH
ncbi:MAG: MATE family efflux transporter [Desulfitobacteriaceae bacterium]